MALSGRSSPSPREERRRVHARRDDHGGRRDETLARLDAGDTSLLDADGLDGETFANHRAVAPCGLGKGLRRRDRIGVAVARAKRGREHVLGDRRRTLAHRGIRREELEIEPLGALPLDERADNRDLGLGAREAQIALTSVMHVPPEPLAERRPDLDGRARERQFGGIASRLAHAAERPAGSHGGDAMFLDQRDRPTLFGERKRGGGAGYSPTNDDDIGHDRLGWLDLRVCRLNLPRLPEHRATAGASECRVRPCPIQGPSRASSG